MLRARPRSTIDRAMRLPNPAPQPCGRPDDELTAASLGRERPPGPLAGTSRDGSERRPRRASIRSGLSSCAALGRGTSRAVPAGLASATRLRRTRGAHAQRSTSCSSTGPEDTNLAELAELFGVGRSTVYRAVVRARASMSRSTAVSARPSNTRTYDVALVTASRSSG